MTILYMPLTGISVFVNFKFVLFQIKHNTFTVYSLTANANRKFYFVNPPIEYIAELYFLYSNACTKIAEDITEKYICVKLPNETIIGCLSIKKCNTLY